jgi:hypothetical protein
MLKHRNDIFFDLRYNSSQRRPLRSTLMRAALMFSGNRRRGRRLEHSVLSAPISYLTNVTSSVKLVLR